MKISLSAFLVSILGLLLLSAQETTAQSLPSPVPQYLVIAIAHPHEKEQARQIITVSEQGADEASINAVAAKHGFTVVKKGYILYAFSPGVVYNNPAALQNEVIECLLQEQRDELCEAIVREWLLYELQQSREFLEQDDNCGAIENWVLGNSPKLKAYVQSNIQIEGVNRDLTGLLYETTLTSNQTQALSRELPSADRSKHTRSKEHILHQLSMRKPAPEIVVQYNSAVPPALYSTFGRGAFEALASLNEEAEKHLEQTIDTFTRVLGASYGIGPGVQPYNRLPEMFQSALRTSYEASINQELLRELTKNPSPEEALAKARVAIRFLPAISFSVECGTRRMDVDLVVPERQIRIHSTPLAQP
ncbi:MAG: hypothetical protein ACK4UU_00480 [Fimbriimonadales bacterium]